ncbi:MAG: hypothetical protein LBI17_00815 [Rickettsiales bacterium]|nr:hypothetical protein [Rickettsiales bacterium]
MNKSKPAGFRIAIPTMTAEKAFDMLCDSLGMLKLWARYGHTHMDEFFAGLRSPLVDEMSADMKSGHIPYDIYSDDATAKERCRSMLASKYFERFVGELYDQQKYDAAKDWMYIATPFVQKTFPRFRALEERWGFKIWDLYQLDADACATGGRYWYDGKNDVGGVRYGCGIGSDYTHIARTVVHEMLHLGIEQSVVRKFGLLQEEKERVVDNLCRYAMDGIIDYRRKDGTWYQEYAAKASYMDRWSADPLACDMPSEIGQAMPEIIAARLEAGIARPKPKPATRSFAASIVVALQSAFNPRQASF